MMRLGLLLIFASIFGGMTLATVQASLDRGITQAWRELWPDLWFRATLLDAYFGFLTFYLWVAYKEVYWFSRIAWFVGIMSLGNFAMSAYMIWQLARMPAFSWQALLLRQSGPAEHRGG